MPETDPVGAGNPDASPQAYCIAWVHVGGIGTVEWVMHELRSNVDSGNLRPSLGLVIGQTAGQMLLETGHWKRIGIREIQLQVCALLGRLRIRHRVHQHLDLALIESSISRHVRAIQDHSHGCRLPPLVPDVQQACPAVDSHRKTFASGRSVGDLRAHTKRLP